MALRTLKSHAVRPGLAVRLRHDTAGGEYRVELVRGGKVYDKETYFADDRADALDAFAAEVRREVRAATVNNPTRTTMATRGRRGRTKTRRTRRGSANPVVRVGSPTAALAAELRGVARDFGLAAPHASRWRPGLLVLEAPELAEAPSRAARARIEQVARRHGYEARWEPGGGEVSFVPRRARSVFLPDVRALTNPTRTTMAARGGGRRRKAKYPVQENPPRLIGPNRVEFDNGEVYSLPHGVTQPAAAAYLARVDELEAEGRPIPTGPRGISPAQASIITRWGPLPAWSKRRRARPARRRRAAAAPRATVVAETTVVETTERRGPIDYPSWVARTFSPFAR